MCVVFLFAFACILVVCPSNCSAWKERIFNNATFGTIYNNTVVRNDDVRFIFPYNFTDKSTAVRIRTLSPNASLLDPVLFVVKQELSVLSWTIPMLLTTHDNQDYSYLDVSRTLCPEQIRAEVKEIVVVVSTMNAYQTSFELVAWLEDLAIVDNIKNVSVSPAESRFYRYEFPSNVSSVIVKVESDDDLCTVVSLQDAECPVLDTYGSVEHVGFRQTMTRRGAITMQSTMFSSSSFFIVLIVMPNDLACENIEQAFLLSSGGNDDGNVTRTKKLNISIKKTMPVGQMIAVISITIVIILCFPVLVILSEVCHCKNKRNNAFDAPSLVPDEEATRDYGTAATPSGSQLEHDGIHSRDRRETSSTSSLEPSVSIEQSDSLESSDTVQIIPTQHYGICCVAWTLFIDYLKKRYQKNIRYVAALATKPREILDMKYNLYAWNLIPLSILYVLPVIQLVITYVKMVYKTGDQDICYYNFYCAHQVGSLPAFNNVISNIGYILLGILFMVIVRCRQRLHTKRLQARDENKPECGIPQHFGVFYAMGIALLSEGILSGCYHVCPSLNNFQFDTAFMYVIGCLSILKLYQTRHPDVTAHAHTAYCAIALLISFGLIGVAQGTKGFEVVFVVIYMLWSSCLSIHIYYIRDQRPYREIICNGYRTLRHGGRICSMPRYLCFWLSLILGNIVNAIVAMFAKDFWSYLLGFIIVILFSYFVFYICMKCCKDECCGKCCEKCCEKKCCLKKSLWLACLYTVLAFGFWMAAIIFFKMEVTSWQMTPAMSRASNKDCLLGEFYDSHDIWHFLSAIGLFFAFMVLLVLDDDLINKPREEIVVF